PSVLAWGGLWVRGLPPRRPVSTPPPRGGAPGPPDAARLARIFGETLPDTTRDERDDDPADRDRGDDWWRSQVPPHHS
ncbi:hypothetical protein, partial [Nocardia farcinica]|uniref:hypothetical protein n=1 Tax=Nocardia farcinica TaxID=37329 RepID=UPI002456BBBD